jgi:hypothetical protein
MLRGLQEAVAVGNEVVVQQRYRHEQLVQMAGPEKCAQMPAATAEACWPQGSIKATFVLNTAMAQGSSNTGVGTADHPVPSKHADCHCSYAVVLFAGSGAPQLAKTSCSCCVCCAAVPAGNDRVPVWV